MDPKSPTNDHSLVNKHIQTLRNHFAMEIPIFYSLNHEGSLQNLPATITNLSEEEGEITFAIVPNESSTEQFITMDISEFISGLNIGPSSPSLLSKSFPQSNPNENCLGPMSGPFYSRPFLPYSILFYMKGCVSPQQIVPLHFIDLPLSLAIVVLATHCFYSLYQPNLAV